MTVENAAKPGRPRSEQSRSAVVRATSELLHEVGLRAMTTEQIAARSGASKATIYKWWPNKYGVAVDAFFSELQADSPDPVSGSGESACSSEKNASTATPYLLGHHL